MLRENLTAAQAKDEVGENPEEFTYVFTATDPYVVANKAAAADESSDTPDDVLQAHARAVNRAQRTHPFYMHLEQGDLFEAEPDITEMLWNAFEHGSNWCQDGNVTVRIFRDPSTKKWLVAIEQPGDGFDVAERLQIGVRYQLRGMLRGGGSATVERSPYAFGFEKDVAGQQHVFRTLILNTTETA
jgi:anti-sigma regulatory factor (Ser/Thr protein kinase)